MSSIHLSHTYYKLSKDILRLLIKKKSHFKHFLSLSTAKLQILSIFASSLCINYYKKAIY